MKKRIFLIVQTLLLCFLMITNVYANDDDFFKGYKKEDIKEHIIDFTKTLSEKKEYELEYMIDNKVGSLQEIIESFYNLKDIIGEYKNFSEIEYNIEGDYVNTTTKFQFDKSFVKVDFKFAEIEGNLIIIEGSYELADGKDKTLAVKMKDAALNTFIGVSSVFIVLIIIAYLISLFKYIPRITKYFEDKKIAKTIKIDADKLLLNKTDVSVNDNSIELNQKDIYKELELIAVITAAIKEFSEVTGETDEFIVRSIRKVNQKVR